MRFLTVTAATLTLLLTAWPARAAPVPRSWHAPAWWLPQAMCIHHYEGAFNAATGNGYEGGYQFLASTYASVGGRVLYQNGRPWHWASLDSPREQTYRAWLLWRRTRDWSQWGTRGRCGL